MAKQKETFHTENSILGRVADTFNRPLANLVVQAFDRDLRTEEILGESITDNQGKYTIIWSHDQLSGRGKKTADIVIKVLTEQKRTLLFSTAIESVRYNASTREKIDVTIPFPAIPQEEIEFDRLVKDVKFLAKKIEIADLQENDQHHDVTFIAKELNVAEGKIEHLIIAHRVQATSKIDAAFFYALLRKNTFLNEDFSNGFRARLIIDIDTEILPLIYDAALTEATVIERDVQSASKEMIVAPSIEQEIKKNLQLLAKYRQKAEEYYSSDHPRKIVDTLTNIVNNDKIGEIKTLFSDFKNDPKGFLNAITSESFLTPIDDPKHTNGNTSTTSSIADLLGFEEDIIDFVKKSQNIKHSKDEKKLAALNKSGWKELLTKSYGKITKGGRTLDKKQIDLQASSLARKLEKEFPSIAFTAQLGREKKSLYKNQDAIHKFLSDQEEFDLQHSNIDLFLKSKKLNTEKNTGMREELKAVQRIFKLIPHYSKTNSLLQQNIHSAQGIVAMGETRFVNEVAPQAGIEASEAKEIFRKAERTHTASMLIVGELQDTMRAMDISAIETSSMAMKLEAVSKDFPNLKSLFKLADVCACEHCRSVYSPAAYLVEILQFIDKRGVVDLTLPAPPPPAVRPTVQLAKAVLFERRPDIGEIDLSCENANTAFPYIDLVCEILEEAIAPDAGIPYAGVLSDGADPFKGIISVSLLTTLQTSGLPVTDQALIFETEITSGSSATLPHYLRDKKVVCKIVHEGGNNYRVFQLRQTLLSAEELNAAPAYVNANAYAALQSSTFAFKLPFDLNHTEGKAYFSRFDILRSELMRDFQAAGFPTAQSIAAEQLGLTDAERSIIVTPDPTNQQQYWNTTTATASDELKVVDTFLHKTGLTYAELDRLLVLRFIDPLNILFIKHLDLSCDTVQKEIANLDDSILDRVHRFLRLQKKTGWKLEVLDEILSQPNLGKGKLDTGDDNTDGITNGNECLIHAATLYTLSQETGIKIEELVGFYGEIPHQEFTDDRMKSLYHQVFQNRATNGFIDENLKPENIDGSQLLSTYSTSLSVSLQLSIQDLDKLLSILSNDDLTFANLSFLFAASRLMRKLKLYADDFIIMLSHTGISIQDSPKATLDFVTAVKTAQKFPLKPADTQFMLRHEATNIADRELQDDKIDTILIKLQADLQKVFTANRSPFNADLTAEEQKESIQLLLSRLITVTEDDVKILLGFIDRDWTSANDAKTFVTTILGDLIDETGIHTSIDALNVAPGPDISAEQNDLVKAYADAISLHQFSLEKLALLEQLLVTSFKASNEISSVIVSHAMLKQPAPGTALICDILLSETLIDTDPTHSIAILPVISSVLFPNHYKALRLLHKLIPLIHAYQADDVATAWYLQHNEDLGWFEWDSIPYEAGQTPILYSVYESFTELTLLAKELTPVPNPADAENPITFLSVCEMLLTGSTATRTTFIENFALLTGYSKDDIDAIDAYLFPVFALTNYRKTETWKAVLKCAEYLRKLSCTVAQVKEFIKPVLTATDTEVLRIALKARYTEDTWLSTLKEVMDAIRPQKRNALVAYLLATNSEMKDENDLYDYFLIDVEMEACMPSSRIVQAHGTVQLFVQRCLMGLEPEAAADRNSDAGWEQWKWMKNYRVWEANRKVFVYPENWIEAELRDDKSFLFSELENELLQNELNEFTAEEALIRYLEKLDTIAFLEIVATWYQSDIKTMHVFGRTKGGDPAIYYYRRFEQERYWTPWEKVDLDITSDHLLAFERNNRLCLAWPVFSEQADPDSESTIPDATAGAVVDNDKPKRKLKIQLAISEFANGQWHPKKISKDGILTPSAYTADDLPRDTYNLIYFEFGQQVWIFSNSSQEYYAYNQLNGIFNITGCKGYPELLFQGNMSFADFLPDFKDTILKAQRYHELNLSPDDLSVKNGISFFNYYEILSKTPGNFRITYPHQITKIDYVAFLFQLLLLFLLGGKGRDRSLKIPLGTLLPYFKEDSNHAYVIIPGFYNVEKSENGEPVYVKRTGSDVLKLIEDIEALYYAIIAYQADPSPEKLAEILNDYQEIVAEFKEYGGLQYGDQFKNMYHPLVCSLRKTLYKDGIAALMKRETQLQTTSFNFNTNYSPTSRVALPYPIEDIDFSSDGSYSAYNWELFFHVPFLLATRLTKNQRFEEALTWFHYMFNPTGALEGTTPQKYWVTKPFYLTQDSDYMAQRIDTLLYKIADPTTPERAELEFAIEEWRNKPFMPHVVARFRPVAYQKALLMKYIDNLTEWGDYLFRQDTMESITQATQMYILADKLLGPKPRIIPPTVKAPYETYNQIEAKLDAFGNALIDLENILPDLSALPEGGAELPPAPVTLSMLYFCIPQNEQMLAYWDRIADRLFKIRHCQNIDGIERSLALFAPPIDPGMLVRAAASGLDISSVLAGMNAPTPYYRFSTLSQKATELVQEVRGLGAGLLATLEKKDAEALSLLRSDLEIKMLNAIKLMKNLQVNEATEQIEVLKKSKAVTQERDTYYTNIEKMNSNEDLNLEKLKESITWQTAANITYALGAGLALIPDFALGVSGFGGSPHGAAKFGGSLLAHSTDAIGKTLNIFSAIASYEANRAAIKGGYDRRYDDWKLQERLAKKELEHIDKLITTAEIRKEIAETDYKNHLLQIENAKKTDEFLHSKFTKKELYEWMIGQISAVYFRAYQLAHDLAKKAERCYRFELGNDDSFIQYGYWDSMKKGLQSADHLFYDLKRMETSYLDKNKREYELTKHVSLMMLDPLALIKLRATGSCDFEIPEAMFDLDHPGQYFRRTKTVSISLPCIAGPYTSVSAKLSLINNRYRKNINPDNLATTGYIEDPGNDERFVYNVGTIQSIATSNAQNDSGVFELNFRDDRYLPFEGTGAISTWRLELPKEIRQFNYTTIADAIIHIRYTAREGGSSLKGIAETALKDRLESIKQELSETGLHIAIDMKHDLPNEWHLFKKNGLIDLTITKYRLPYMAQTLDAAIENVMFVAKVKGNPATFSITIDGTVTNLSKVEEWEICKGTTTSIALDTPFELSLATTPLSDLEELTLVVKYSF
jgi:hypothetical protein